MLGTFCVSNSYKWLFPSSPSSLSPTPSIFFFFFGFVSIAIKCLVMNMCFVAGVNRKAIFYLTVWCINLRIHWIVFSLGLLCQNTYYSNDSRFCTSISRIQICRSRLMTFPFFPRVKKPIRYFLAKPKYSSKIHFQIHLQKILLKYVSPLLTFPILLALFLYKKD